jgi:hypothetical protein
MTPTAGRIVHFTLPPWPEVAPGVPPRNAGEIRGAVVTRVWSDTHVNLRVFTDGENDAGQLEYHTSVAHGTGPGQWQWPSKV